MQLSFDLACRVIVTNDRETAQLKNEGGGGMEAQKLQDVVFDRFY